MARAPLLTEPLLLLVDGESRGPSGGSEALILSDAGATINHPRDSEP